MEKEQSLSPIDVLPHAASDKADRLIPRRNLACIKYFQTYHPQSVVQNGSALFLQVLGHLLIDLRQAHSN